MENIKNKRINYILQDKKYSRGTINSINHTNINNNINITNYYPSLSQNYCNNETFTFINNNDNTKNNISYPVKTSTHKTKTIKDISPIPKACDKKYNQCQSPYMKKILPSSKRQKSEDGNRKVKIYKNSPSFKYIKSNKKKPVKYIFYNDNISERKNETQSDINNNQTNNKNYYLDLSSDEISNKHKTNRNHNSNFYSNTNQEINKIKYISKKLQNKYLLNNKSMISNESNDKESLFNFIEKPAQISLKHKEKIYKITSYDKGKLLTYNFNSPKFAKNNNNKLMNNNNNKKEIIIGKKKLNQYIILIQSSIRGYLLRLKLAQYLNLYERIKKAVFIIQFLIFKKMRFNLYLILKNNINEKLTKYYRLNSYLRPSNNISLEFKTINSNNNKIITEEAFILKNNSKSNIYQDNMKNRNKSQVKNNNEVSDIQKELNKRIIDFAFAEKKIKELLIENKKIQNINNIIVRDNRQLALKLKHLENNNFNKLKMQNSNLYIPNISYKNKIKLKINNLLNKIITRKSNKTTIILYKYFYKFNLKTNLIHHKDEINAIKNNHNSNNNINNKLIIENNNFIINENIIKTNNIINNNNNNDINNNNNEIKTKILKSIINKKNINAYIYKNVFEKWMLRALIVKNKDFVKEKKKKKKEKFKQRKQKKLYGNSFGTNDKKTEEENDNSMDYSDECEGEQKYSVKSGSGKKNYYTESYKK